ncbi:MAG: RNA pseudouridine synthase [Candidatus Dadabacteria bacterium]|nr:MAG: RNA pseudouridine synthase [Candidatus Dadabacteria bacterium]
MSKEKPYIVDETKELVFYYKPPGLYTTATKSTHSLEHYIKQSFSTALPESGLLSRLDLWTSGGVLAAKSEKTYSNFKKLQKEGYLKKEYLAVVLGHFKKEGIVKTLIAARYRRSKKVKAFSLDELRKVKKTYRSAQRAEAQYNFIDYNKKLNLSLIEVILSKGRRHQIRAQLQFLGHPLLGDELYGSSLPLKDLLPPLEEHYRYILHCKAVKAEHNSQKPPLFFYCPPSKILQKVLFETFKNFKK